MSILALLQLALSLLVSVQAPNVSAEIRQQALDTAKQIVAIASIQIQSMDQATSTPESQPTQPAQNPAPTQSEPTSTPIVTQTQPPQEPVLGGAVTISQPSFSVNITQVTSLENGGEFFFTIEGKTGTPDKPELILDEVTTNLRSLPTVYKLPPIVGTTNSYRMGITLPKVDYPQNPFIKVKIGDETVEQSITIQ